MLKNKDIVCVFAVFALIVHGDAGVKFVPVKEGDSVSLNSDLTEMKDDDVIQWWFENRNTLIAEINETSDRFTVYDDVLDGRFRYRLKLDNQTGSLTITNTRTEHEGYYRLLINSVRKSFYLTFIDQISVTEGDSVTLDSDLTEINDDRIQWMFGDALIADSNKQDDRITVYDDVLDGRFKDRLKLNKQTGSLTITNITTEHVGHYKRLIGPSPLVKIFSVSVYDSGLSPAVVAGICVAVLLNVAGAAGLIYCCKRQARRGTDGAQ
ncbi:uncharacterized protein [Chanodichthys erythropterus]|uniref:uncharacterized protein isoform X1 n=1 Tax=Chanodichthys erythropterus TaxID=933992 RepID=UPI00351DFB23